MSNYNMMSGYVGNKATFSEKIKSFFDESCTSYVETNVGSGAIFFSMPNDKYESEYLNDSNFEIMSMYSALMHEETRDRTIELIYKIEKNDCVDIARDEWKEARNEMKDINPIELKENTELMIKTAVNAYRVYSQSFNQAAISYSSKIKNLQYKAYVRRSIPKVVERLSSKPFLGVMNCLDVVEKFKNNPETQLFIDPPYVGLYRKCRKLYGCEMDNLIEHIKLAESIKDSKAAIVLCGYRSPVADVPTIYDAILGDDWHCFIISETYNKAQVLKPGDSRDKCQEFIWTNRVPERAKYYVSMNDYKEKITMDEYWKRIKEFYKTLQKSKEAKEYNNTYKELYGKELFD